jgi:ribosomal protein S18 acetylase RimI-like enzyme
MKFLEITCEEFPDFKEVWDIYVEAFPKDEQRPLAKQVKLFGNPIYKFYAVYEDNLVGLIACWNLNEILFIEHLAVKKDLRNRGIGTRILRAFLADADKAVLESYRPKTELAKRRVRFYDRLGFKMNTFDYIQPAYDPSQKPVPMYLVSYPETLDEEEYVTIRNSIHKEVYGCDEPVLRIRH